MSARLMFEITKRSGLKPTPHQPECLQLSTCNRRCKADKRRSTQINFINCQLSTVNCQLSTVNCQLSTV
ncbi:MAG: hypothetical protein HC942_15840 [Microcoleus sp. SU_5_6]|nr:hypothetical protein [Microcoleus sp. SU_5_6]